MSRLGYNATNMERKVEQPHALFGLANLVINKKRLDHINGIITSLKMNFSVENQKKWQ